VSNSTNGKGRIKRDIKPRVLDHLGSPPEKTGRKKDEQPSARGPKVNRDRQGQYEGPFKAKAADPVDRAEEFEEDECLETPTPRAGSMVQVEIDGAWKAVSVTELTRTTPSDRNPDPWFHRCLFSRDDKVSFDLGGLLEMLDFEVEQITKFIARVAREDVLVSVVAGGTRYEDVVEAILSLTPAALAPRQLKRIKEAALRYAALADMNNLEVPVNQVLKWLRRHDLKGVDALHLTKAAKRLAGVSKRKRASFGAEALGHVHPETIRAAFPDAPVSEMHQIPLYWEVHELGVARSDGREADDIKGLIVVTGRALVLSTGEEMLRLAYRKGGRWVERLVPRAEAADSRKVVGLAAHGFPVTSANARDFVRYISDYERHNLKHLPVERVARQLGWQGDGEVMGFLLGETYICAEQPADAEAPSARVSFQGADEGDKQAVRGFRTQGTLEDWLAAIAPVAQFPRVKLEMYAASAAPLLRVVGAGNCVKSTAGETTTGKTTSLQVAASIFGNPEKDAADSIVHSWDGTSVFRERAPAVQTDLPFCLDETQRAKDAKDVQQTIYDISHGQGRGRGSPAGLAGRGSFRTVCLTTGEKPVVSFTEAGGTRARVVEVWGSPFGGQSQALGGLIWNMVRGVEANFGHAGVAYIRHLVENRRKWPDWKAEFKELVGHFQKKAGGNAVAGRLAESFAVITLAARLLHEAVPMPWAYADPIEPLYDELVSEVKEVDRSAAALRSVVEWADARPKLFMNSSADVGYCDQSDRDGWAGIRPFIPDVNVEEGTTPKNGASKAKAKATKAKAKATMTPKKPEYALGFFPDRLKKILKEGGHDPEAILRSWKGKGWLRFTTEGNVERNTYRVRIRQRAFWIVAITEEAIKAARTG